MRAKKSLGQNFLTSRKALENIITAADLTQTDIVLEIGPGRGALTASLLAKAGKVVAVEKDDVLIAYLQELFEKEINEGRFILIHGDILEISPNTLRENLGQHYKLVANIPYYITGALLRLFLSSKNIPTRMVLMLQKEVARRIVTRDQKESILSLSVKAYGIPQYISTVEAIHFTPKPNVDSAILLIKDISKKFFTSFNEEKFFVTIKAAFAHKRKIAARNLEGVYGKEHIARAYKECGVDERARAEDLSLETWKCLSVHL